MVEESTTYKYTIAKIATSARIAIIAIIAKARATANPFAADFADER